MHNIFTLPDGDVYEITPLESMNDLLIPETSLCVIHKPCWKENFNLGICPTESFHVRGVSNSGKMERVDFERGSKNYLGWYKYLLDKHLLSAYLFISWRKRGGYTFKMFQQHELIAEFSDFDSAIAAYLPDGFMPRNVYHYADLPSGLYRRYLRRRALLFSLLRLLQRHTEQLSLGKQKA